MDEALPPYSAGSTIVQRWAPQPIEASTTAASTSPPMLRTPDEPLVHTYRSSPAATCCWSCSTVGARSLPL
ncbi:hypothetical protein [Saccharopolyspora mangrovi]|uniref:Uncharacterized protein n=1 Tax=Saccharopolyspora mangrovi TaxID=3082379 RepID=A0ABU6A5T2_9PSEU|nr:hypothetical protein [Saccharopolyspora sp. S2-29]MEB3366813.1 hypothetical protein [Saccharopolyspora sp. S2-29]